MEIKQDREAKKSDREMRVEDMILCGEPHGLKGNYGSMGTYGDFLRILYFVSEYGEVLTYVNPSYDGSGTSQSEIPVTLPIREVCGNLLKLLLEEIGQSAFSKKRQSQQLPFSLNLNERKLFDFMRGERGGWTSEQLSDVVAKAGKFYPKISDPRSASGKFLLDLLASIHTSVTEGSHQLTHKSDASLHSLIRAMRDNLQAVVSSSESECVVNG